MKNITLEMSLKPFKKTDSSYIEAVCKKVFEQWKPLVKSAEVVSVMLWSADGSELLDYKGDLNESFEWAYLIGGAQNRAGKHSDTDPDGIGLHATNYNYIENPPVMTYGILKEIVETIKKIGSVMLCEKKIRVGTTFDPGPEFAKSSFKYERHNEICTGGDIGFRSMVCSYTKLNGDSTHYAAYPDGIPDGTPFGTFFGKQANIFMQDIGFDYIWLSNGIGFGRETWSPLGAIFDGEKFNAEELEGVKKDVADFWTLFRNECPTFPIETRGTNMSMGIDYATDGVPLKEIYNGGYNMLPPPNSPWAALDGDFGLELMGHMSRIAYVPEDKYLFRYYIHDIWWANSPWYDRYNGLPHDIYLPLSICRIDESGKIKVPTNLNLLSIDNSFGDFPDACVNEPIPHLLKAIKEMPDEVSPVVWVYPFDEYSNAETEQELKEMYSQDWFIRGAINNGCPISSVTTTTAFTKQDKKIYSASILISPVPKKNTEFEKQIIEYANNGGRVIFYGNTMRAGKAFMELTGLKHSEKISGELEISIHEKKIGIIKHTPLICAGEISEKATRNNEFINIGGKTAGIHEKNFVWLRGTVSSDLIKGQRLPIAHDEKKFVIGERLLLNALSLLGITLEYEKDISVKNPVMMCHRYNNAFIFSSYMPSTTVKTKMKLPYGAPVLNAYSTKLENGYATYHFPKAEHKECRVFVEQNNGIVSCREIPPVSYYFRRRVEVSGLENATVRFLAEDYCKNDFDAVLNSHVDMYFVGDEFEGEYVEIDGITFYEARNITGSIVFSMPFKKNNN